MVCFVMRFPRFLTIPGRHFLRVFSLHQGKMVDGFSSTNGEGRSGWVGSVYISNVVPNHFFGVSRLQEIYKQLITTISTNATPGGRP